MSHTTKLLTLIYTLALEGDSNVEQTYRHGHKVNI
jgi:hypothetical protein